MHRFFFISLAALSALPWSAQAEWNGKGSAGLVLSRGNTTTNTANASLDLVNELERWKHQFSLAGLYASNDSSATAQRWNAQTQTDFKFSDRGFWFEKLRYEQDRFSGYLFQGTASTGVGHKFFDTDRTKLSAQIGAGYRVSHVGDTLADDGVTPVPAYYSRETIFSGAFDYRQSLTETTTLLNKFTVESGSSNTFLQNDLQIQLKVNTVLAVALGFTVKRNSAPSDGYKATDTLTTINLVYEFKGTPKPL